MLHVCWNVVPMHVTDEAAACHKGTSIFRNVFLLMSDFWCLVIALILEFNQMLVLSFIPHFAKRHSVTGHIIRRIKQIWWTRIWNKMFLIHLLRNCPKCYYYFFSHCWCTYSGHSLILSLWFFWRENTRLHQQQSDL